MYERQLGMIELVVLAEDVDDDEEDEIRSSSRFKFNPSVGELWWCSARSG